jgi:hypothetical protein
MRTLDEPTQGFLDRASELLGRRPIHSLFSPFRADSWIDDAALLLSDLRAEMTTAPPSLNGHRKAWIAVSAALDKAAPGWSSAALNTGSESSIDMAVNAIQRLGAAPAHDQRAAEPWGCEQCNKVFPHAPQRGLKCTVCPDCGGSTMPLQAMERRRLERQLNGCQESSADAARWQQGMIDGEFPICRNGTWIHVDRATGTILTGNTANEVIDTAIAARAAERL